MTNILETVLLLALPASGKSEVRKYLRHLSPAESAQDFHLGPSVQLDDFPYVHLMRRIDDELVAQGEGRIYFVAADRSFRDTRHWGTLIHLVNEDYDDLVNRKTVSPESAAEHLFARLDRAARAAGITDGIGSLPADVRGRVAEELESEAADALSEKQSGYVETLQGKTVVIEFARGGPQGAAMPLTGGFGYRYSLSHLSDAILQKAVILYVWVTPEESRRKNEARADPDDPGSILHHSVPLPVMLNDYGCDDMDWLEESSPTPGTVTVRAHGKEYAVPVARFDNRVDKTSFLREASDAWKPEDRRAVHDGLKAALDKLAEHRGS